MAADTAPGGVTPTPALALAEAAAFEGTNPTVPVAIYSTAAGNTTMAPRGGRANGRPAP